MKNLIIFGVGGFGREILDVINAIVQTENKWNFLGFSDDNIDLYGKIIHGFPVLGNLEDVSNAFSNEDVWFICSVGDPKIRKQIVERIHKFGFKFATLVHPNATLTEYVKLGEGVVICAGVIFTNEISVGNHVIINLGVTIGHDVIIEDFVTLNPGVHINGKNIVREGVYIGSGAVTIQNITIGAWSIIGAGAVVVNNIEQGITAVGVPAKKISY